jgi:hypothetical protein
MTTTTKTERPLSPRAAGRVNKLREQLSGARADSRAAQRLHKNRASNPLVGVALHAAARLAEGHPLSDLEQSIVDALGTRISPEEIKEWGTAYRETKGSRKNEFLPDAIAALPIETPYTIKDLAISLPELSKEVEAQPNVRVVDIAGLAPDQELDPGDEAFLAAAKELGTSVTVFMNTAVQPKPAPDPTSAEAGSGETLSASEVFMIVPTRLQTIQESAGEVGSDEIFWAMAAGSDTGDKWEYRSREFGSCDTGDWDYFHGDDRAFVGRVNTAVTLNVELWEADAGQVFGEITKVLYQVANACMDAAVALQEGAGSGEEGNAAGWAALIAAVAALVGFLLSLFVNDDDFVDDRNFGWTRSALLSLQGQEKRFRFGDRDAGIHDLYLKVHVIPTGAPVRLVAKHSNKDITIDAGSTANSAAVHQWEWSNVAHQKFRLEWLGGKHFRIVAVHSGKVLDVRGSSHSSGTAVVQYSQTGNNNQSFRFNPQGDAYAIVAEHSGKVLEVMASNMTNGRPIVQYHWTGEGENQKWRIVRV